jgi:hypothetical protein
MNDTNIENVQVLAAESYLEAKRTLAPATIKYNYKDTYNYILSTLKRFV